MPRRWELLFISAVIIISAVVLRVWGSSERQYQRDIQAPVEQFSLPQTTVVHRTLYQRAGEFDEMFEFLPTSAALPETLWVAAISNGDIVGVFIYVGRPAGPDDFPPEQATK